MINRSMQTDHKTATLGTITLHKIPRNKILTGMIAYTVPNGTGTRFFLKDAKGKLWTPHLVSGSHASLSSEATATLLAAMLKLGLITQAQFNTEEDARKAHEVKVEHIYTLKCVEDLIERGVIISSKEIKRLEKLAGRKADLTPRYVKGE